MKDFTLDKRLSIHIVAVLETWEADAVVPVSFQDQRLVGLPSLCVHLPVRRHAHLVSLPHFSSKSLKVRTSWCRICPGFVPTGLKASSTKCSGTSLYPTVCTKVRSHFCLQPSLRIKICVFCQQDTDSCFIFRVTDDNCLSAGFVQFLQYYYQSGCLYRLRTLGERHTMDLTVGQHNLMF